MSDQGLWFKLWCSALDDQELENLTEHEWFCWARLGTYIKKHGKEGSLKIKPPARVILHLLREPDFNALISTIKRLPNVFLEEEKSTVSGETDAIVSIKVTYQNWYPFQGDFSTARVRRWREKQRYNVTDKRRGEEKRREENPPSPVSTSFASQDSKSKATPKEPTEADRKAARKAIRKLNRDLKKQKRQEKARDKRKVRKNPNGHDENCTCEKCWPTVIAPRANALLEKK